MAKGLVMSGVSERKAREDTTALLIAKYVEQGTGERQLIENSMTELFKEPERMGSVVLTLLNLVSQYATVSGTQPMRLKSLIDFLIEQDLRDH